MNKGAVREIRGEKMYEADLLKYVSSNFWQQKLDQKSTYIVIRKSYLSYKSNFFILFFASTKILH